MCRIASALTPARPAVFAPPSGNEHNVKQGAGRRSVWILGAAAAALVLALGFLSVRMNGRLVYPLDDPYIHMSLARNLAQHGVWGVHGDEFTSASSSPLWTVLLAGVFRVAGPGDWTPLVLDAIAAALCVLAAGGLLGTIGVEGGARAAALAAMIVLAPLGPIGVTGMEHVAHAAAVMAFVALMARALESGGSVAAACVTAAVMCGLRFEGLFVAAAATLLLLGRRRWFAAAALVASAWLPVLMYARYSTTHGAMWLPNPIAIKGHLGSMASPGAALAALAGKWLTRDVLVEGASVLLLIAVAVVALLRLPRETWSRPGAREYATIVFVIGALLHLQLAGLGWFFRYEMYLVALGVVVVAAHLGQLLRRTPSELARRRAPVVVYGILVLAALGVAARAAIAHARTPRAMREIAMQQVPMAQFLARYYDRRSIAANDIGVISWYTDVALLDLWGLANVETAHMLMRGGPDPATIARLAAEHRVAVAVVYDEVLGPRGANGRVAPPPGWRKVGSWRLDHNIVVGHIEVCFYAVAPGEEAPLRAHLEEFSGALPAEVRARTFARPADAPADASGTSPAAPPSGAPGHDQGAGTTPGR